LAPGLHLCCLYETEEEHRAVLTPYLRQGLEKGEKLVYIADAHTREAVLQYLTDDGFEPGAFVTGGQLVFTTPEETYLREGSFDPDKMITFLGSATDLAVAEGYPAFRVTGEMTWALRGAPGSDRLIEYESKLNDFFPGSKCLAICQYDRRRFEPPVLLDVLSTHPTVVVGTEVYDNFYYTPPAEFLRRDLPATTLHYWLENLAARKRAEEALRESQALFEGLFEYAPDGIMAVSQEGKIGRLNRQVEAMFGYAREELVGKPVEMLVPERFAQGHAIHRAGYLAQPCRRPMGTGLDLYGRRKDGGEFPLDITLSPLETAEGRVVLSIIRDTTERKRSEELDRFFSLSIDMMCIAGFDGHMKILNPAWERALGFSQEELRAEPYINFVHPDDREATIAEAQKLATGTDVVCFSNRYATKYGSYRWLRWNATPYQDQQLIYATARDFTDLKEAEDEIRRVNAELATTNRELEAFTYSVSHDLRAPLRHVEGFSKLLLDEYSAELPDEARHYLKRVREGALRMGALVDDLLNLARIGRKGLTFAVTGLNSLLEEAVRELSPEMAGREVETRIGTLPFVECDPALMKQVFVNLLSNALKFTRPRERALIEVGMAESDGRNGIFVRDNGVGFNMKYADKLFGIFQRLHRQEDFEGTGVGLATVQRIIHKHGGRIWAEAELNKGATFYFTLGARESEAEKDGRG
jgi:PAS domain S-box-containing protein